MLNSYELFSDKYDGQKKVKSRVRDLLEILGVVDYFCEISLENYFELEKKISTLINYDSINCKLEEFSASSGLVRGQPSRWTRPL